MSFFKVTNGLWEGYQLLNTANYTACLFISLKSVYKHSCPINYTMYCEQCMMVIALMPKQGDQKSWPLKFCVTLVSVFIRSVMNVPNFITLLHQPSFSHCYLEQQTINEQATFTINLPVILPSKMETRRKSDKHWGFYRTARTDGIHIQLSGYSDT